ncbi:CRIP2 protein, partial [Polypterus senegalus]|nr:CRIP2 protein [Polypterus senegalus]
MRFVSAKTSAVILAHDGKPYCHKPCYAALYGPKGVNIGGAGSYVYEAPAGNSQPASLFSDEAPKPQERKPSGAPRGPVKAEKVTSLGQDWHRPCLRCERCNKTLAAGSHAEVRADTFLTTFSFLMPRILLQV